MEASVESAKSTNGLVDVLVSDFFGQHRVDLPGRAPSTPIADIVGETRARLMLSPALEWQIQDARTARLLRFDQTLGEVATEGKADLRMTPDARLG